MEEYSAKERLTNLWERQLAGEDVQIAYWNSDPWGRSANGGSTDKRWHAAPGAVQEIDDDIELAICPGPSQGGLHATKDPHRWAGQRVWIVALFGNIKKLDGKMAARKREIICEVTPDCLLSPQIATRMGVSLKSLQGADLQRAGLQRADLKRADLRGADLRDADLRGADLRGADLRDADLRGANLQRASLQRASLQRADLEGADLEGADLRGTNLPSGY